MDNDFDQEQPHPATTSGQRGPGTGIAIAIAVLALAAAAWFALHRGPSPEPAAPVAQADAGAPAAAPDAPLPPVAESDAKARSLLGALSSRPEWAAWLSAGNLIERATVVLDNLALDVSPRKQLPFLSPAKPFSATGRGAKLSIAKASYARYDAVADVVASLDAKGFAQAVRTLQPLLQTAYHALGYPDRPVEPALALALKRLSDAPVVEGEVALREEGALYRLQDPKLEAMGEVEKHLLRMGPRNTRLIQAKAKEIAAALAAP